MVGGRPNHSTANIQTLLYPGDGHGVFGSMLRSCSMIKMAYPSSRRVYLATASFALSGDLPQLEQVLEDVAKHNWWAKPDTQG